MRPEAPPPVPPLPTPGVREPYLVQLVHLGLASQICFIIRKHLEPETGDEIRKPGHGRLCLTL